MRELKFSIDDQLCNEVENLLDDIGLEMQSIIKMLFTRIRKEKSIAFLISNQSRNTVKSPEPEPEPEEDNYVELPSTAMLLRNKTDGERMSKSIAKRLFWRSGYDIASNITFASKNSVAYNYWANPNFSVLQVDWSLILNDLINNKLYLFNIPANSFKRDDFLERSDKPYLIDLQIRYGDETFTDSRSGISFLRFLKGSLNY